MKAKKEILPIVARPKIYVDSTRATVKLMNIVLMTWSVERTIAEIIFLWVQIVVECLSLAMALMNKQSIVAPAQIYVQWIKETVKGMATALEIFNAGKIIVALTFQMEQTVATNPPQLEVYLIR